MAKETKELTRTQLIGQIASLRGSLCTLLYNLRPQGNKNLKEVLQKYLDDEKEFVYLEMDLDDVEELIKATTTTNVSDADLVDDKFDMSWRDF